MSLSFQERFKNRTNVIGKQGTIDVQNSVAISKPLQSQVFEHKPVYPVKQSAPTEFDMNSVYSYPESYGYSEAAKYSKDPCARTKYEEIVSPRRDRIQEPISTRKQAKSAKPFRNVPQAEIRNEVKTSQGKLEEDYTPYTLKDYQNIKSDKYYELGGLGPANIGTEEWKQRKEALDKRIMYSKHVKMANSNLPPSNYRRPKEQEKEISKREKAKQFAKMIPKPAKKSKSIAIEEKPPAMSSVLEELEKQHQAYKASVEAIKSGINL